MPKKKETKKPMKKSTIKKTAGKTTKKKAAGDKPQPKSTIDDSEYVYLIHPIRFLEQKQNVYKLGKTTGHNCRNRFSGYDKNSRIKLIMCVPDCHIAEYALIKEFDKRYKKRKDVGNEYYQGDLNKMKSTFMRIVRSYPEDDLNPSWPRWIWNGAKKLLWW